MTSKVLSIKQQKQQKKEASYQQKKKRTKVCLPLPVGGIQELHTHTHTHMEYCMIFFFLSRHCITTNYIKTGNST